MQDGISALINLINSLFDSYILEIFLNKIIYLYIIILVKFNLFMRILFTLMFKRYWPDYVRILLRTILLNNILIVLFKLISIRYSILQYFELLSFEFFDIKKRFYYYIRYKIVETYLELGGMNLIFILKFYYLRYCYKNWLFLFYKLAMLIR